MKALGHVRGRVLLLSAASGYLSLSQEILWYRTVSYATAGAPAAFAYLLGLFLLGIALGALVAQRLAQQVTAKEAGPTVAALFAFSSLMGFFTLPASGELLQWWGEPSLPLIYCAAGAVAFPMGILFPLLCHAGIQGDGEVGSSLAGIYLSNVLGAVLGPLLTTFVLMDLFDLGQLSRGIALAGLGVAAWSLFAFDATRSQRLRGSIGLAAAAVTFFVSYESQYHLLMERLHFKEEVDPSQPYALKIENRSGVLAVDSLKRGATLYGGGIWDGSFNIDLVDNFNNVRRALLLSMLHPDPRDLLVIGLASGSWAWVAKQDPRMQSMTAVEINPGYLQIIPHFSPHNELLTDPKVQLVVDDGRRWLERKPNLRFDAILSNTTFHWRSGATALLSEEFMRLCQSHLKPGGMLLVNTTGLDAIRFTAARVFKHVVAFGNSLIASDSPLDATAAEKRSRLLAMGGDSHPLLSPQKPAEAKVIDLLATTPFPDDASKLLARTDLQSITDDNMYPEYGLRLQLYRDDWSWLSFLKRSRDGAGPHP